MSNTDYTGRFSKACSQCGQAFTSGKYDGPRRFAEREFCGKLCAGRGIVARKKPRFLMPMASRFWPKVMVLGPGDCWEWQAATYPDGYGCIQDTPGKNVGAHVASWRLAFGEIPDGLCVLHRCDNPPCVNPAHLFTGTRGDNNRDRDAKGRGGQLKGSSHPRAKVGVDDVRQIRERIKAGETHADLAGEFGIGVTTVGHIVHRRSWKHVE